MLYFDTSYLVRLYTKDPGWEIVRELAKTQSLVCCIHGKAEVVAAFHRKMREGALKAKELRTLVTEFEVDSDNGACRWLPLTSAAVTRLTAVYAGLPSNIAFRSADAIHLACAAEGGFAKIYSNDTRLLIAAPHFGLKGENVI